VAEVPPVYVQFKGDTTDLNVAIGQAKKSLNGFAVSANEVVKATKSLSIAQIALGGIIANIATQAAASAKQFAMSFVGDYQHVASEVRTLSKVMDGTPEQLSAIRFAASRFGVDADALSRSVRLLSRNLAANNKTAQALGISYRDSNGNMLPTVDIIGKLADKYQSMPSKIAANAFAMQAFGRSGANMAPLLGLGSDGIKKLGLDAQELGLIMSGEDLEAVKKYSYAQKDLKEAIEGVKVTIGRDLLPIMSDAATRLNETLLPALKEVASAFSNSGIAGGVKQSQLSLQNFILGLDGIKLAVFQVTIAFVSMKTAMAFVMYAPRAFALMRVSILSIKSAVDTVRIAFSLGRAGVKAFFVSIKAGLISTGIGAFIVILGLMVEWIITAYMTSETFRNKVNGVFTSVIRNAVIFINKLITAVNWVRKLAGLSQYGMLTAPSLNGNQDGNANTREDRKGVYQADTPVGSDDKPPKDSSGSKAKKAKKIDYDAQERKRAIAELRANMALVASNFKAAQSGAKGSIANMQKVAEEYLAKTLENLTGAKGLENKTRHTKEHAAAVNALAAATRNYAAAQKYSNAVTKQAADAAAAATEEQNRLFAALQRSQNASKSWLAARSLTSGPTQANFGGFIEVPVVIDGQTVFRATQRYSLLNNRRNTANGLTTSGSLI
jgi:hypothetical protein